jgi:hypothetical protein
MSFKQVPIDVYRLYKPSGRFSDPDYIKIKTVYGTVQPYTGDEGNYSSQVMQNVRYLITFEDPDEDIRKADELFFENEFHRVQFRQPFRNILPHLEVFTAETQWVR